VVAGTAVYLLVSWAVFATMYCGPVWLLGFFANRDLTLRSSWKFSGAALMPGALAMLAAIFFYGIGMFDLVQMGFAFAVHLLLGWIYLAVSLYFVPRIGEANVPGNPFTTGKK